MRTDVTIQVLVDLTSSLPSWVPPVGTFARVPAVNTLQSVAPAVYKLPTGGFLQGCDPGVSFAAWSSGVFASEAGAKGQAVFIGEDHAAYSYISTNVFDFDTLSWKITNVPSRAYSRRADSPVQQQYPLDKWTFYNYDPDYIFNPGHTYDGLSYFPKSWGSQTQDGQLFLHRGSTNVNPPERTPDVIKLRDFSKVTVPDVKMWDSALAQCGVDVETTYQVVPTYPNSAADNARKGWWCSSYSGAKYLVFVPSDGSIPILKSKNGTGWLYETIWKWEAKDVLLGFHNYWPGNTSSVMYTTMRVINCDTGVSSFVPLEVPPEVMAKLDLPQNGGPMPTHGYEFNAFGFKYSETLNAFVGYRGKGSTDLFILNLPSDPFVGPYVMSAMSFTSNDGSTPNYTTNTETFGRFMEVPHLKSFFWADSSTLAPQLFRVG